MTQKAYNFVIGKETHTLLSADKAYLFEVSHKDEITSKFESILEIDFELEYDYLEIEEQNSVIVVAMDGNDNKYEFDVVMRTEDDLVGDMVTGSYVEFDYLMYKDKKIDLKKMSEEFQASLNVDLINECGNRTIENYFDYED